MLAPITVVLIVLFVVLVIVAFVANARRDKREVRQSLDGRQAATFVVQIVLSVIVAGGSAYLLITGKGSDADRSAFFALLGGVVGYWLRT